jgi:hypothetical protein
MNYFHRLRIWRRRPPQSGDSYKDKGGATDELLAPYLEQAGKSHEHYRRSRKARQGGSAIRKSHKPDEKAKKKNAAESRQRNLPTNNHFGHKAGSIGPTKLRRRLTGRSSATRAMLVLSQLINTY